MSDDFDLDGDSADAASDAIDLSGIAERIEQQRETSRDFRADQKSRLDSIDARLTNDVDAIAAKLMAWAEYESELSDWHESIEKKAAELEQRRQDFEETRRQEEESLRSERAALEAGDAEQLKQLHAEIENLKVQLADESDAVAAARQERDELLANSVAASDGLRTQLESELQTTRKELDKSRDEKSALEQELSQSVTELQQRAEQIRSLQEQTRESSCDTSESSARLLADVREERDNLLEEVAQLRSQQGQQSADQPELAKLRRKFELAVEKVRELKAHNTQLEQRLGALESSRESTETVSDWETQKNQVLAELEGVNSAEEAGAVGTAAPADVESDDLANERETLERLQAEWQKKLSAAEVEISIERAQNARMRTELLEKMRDLEEQLDLAQKESGETTDTNGKSRSRWLDRLGLSEKE